MQIILFRRLCLAFLLAGMFSTAAHAFVGVVKTVEGEATITRKGKTLNVVTGMEIEQADIVRTARDGLVGLIFSDDSMIALGPGTEISVDDYLFEPLGKKLSLVIQLIRGTMSFISGQIAKLAPESVQLVMPAATIGVRGTHVLMKVE
ncbi:conserved exported hypothetical protein [Desulfosarcina cetonica]|uniref:FecR family protein n=1 Tax=Desulfosarcina cetonica TaxID=90730 RepID=UPI0006D09C75|nr:FecR domain-containing protein [Desulfosarcina cetonica]VTR66513.1 conserved exported hypothetical protein [Desulfosarcina cetonica]